MSWGTSWGNAWSGTWGDEVSLIVAESRHVETSDPCVLLQSYVIAIAHTQVVLNWPLTTDAAIYTTDNTSITADGALVTLELIQANILAIESVLHDQFVDAILLSQYSSLTVYTAIHGHTGNELGYFIIPELRLAGVLIDSGGAITVSGVQCAVFDGINLYSQPPVLRIEAITITNGQISIQNSVFDYATIDNDYLAIFYKPGPPRIGGGPYPASVVNSNA